jgi:hypothetical protein
MSIMFYVLVATGWVLEVRTAKIAARERIFSKFSRGSRQEPPRFL